MNKKRVVGLSIMSSVTSLLLTAIVSAQTTTQNQIISNIQNFTDTIYYLVQPLIVSLLGNASTPELFLAKFLLAFVLFAVVWAILDKVNFLNGNQLVLWVISLAIPILGIRFLSEDWIQTILLPYSTIGIAISALIPLMVYFVLVQSFDSSTFRKIAWILAAVIFIGLYVTRFDELAQSAWVYPTAAGACIAFLLLDKTIKKAWSKVKTDNLMEMHHAERKMDILKKNKELDDNYFNGLVTPADYKRLKKALKAKADPYGIVINVP